jgi:phage repressor protein C with HTH and peptisase S24 domain
MIKRLEMLPGAEKIVVMSDNKRYREHELSQDDVRVYGRVVAWFQWRG